MFNFQVPVSCCIQHLTLLYLSSPVLLPPQDPPTPTPATPSFFSDVPLLSSHAQTIRPLSSDRTRHSPHLSPPHTATNSLLPQSTRESSVPTHPPRERGCCYTCMAPTGFLPPRRRLRRCGDGDNNCNNIEDEEGFCKVDGRARQTSTDGGRGSDQGGKPVKEATVDERRFVGSREREKEVRARAFLPARKCLLEKECMYVLCTK